MTGNPGVKTFKIPLCTVMLSLHSLLLGGIVGYVIGSIPSAYLITKWKAGLDLRQEGSRNIGAMNAYEVTGKRSIGQLVLAADLLKGFLPVLVFEVAGLSEPLLVLIPALVLGHCYPIWLRFHGGRGLATTAGALALVNPPAVLIWLAIYGITKKFRDHVHFASIVASGGALLLLLVLPIKLIEATTLGMSGVQEDGRNLQVSIGLVVLIILSRHIEPFLLLLRNRSR
jgi:acyl-phosphate glycerol 3-phosphate acyltransferase